MNIFKYKLSRSNLFVILLYLLLAIIFTYPLIWNMSTFFIGKGGEDGFQYAWNVFTFWRQIFHLQNPFFTDQIFYPVGANLVFHDYSPLIAFFALPFLGNLVFYLNLVLIAGLVLSGLSAYSLAKYLIKDTKISFLVGCLYAFSPTMSSYLLSQHYYYALGPVFLPIGILLTFKLFDQGIKYLKFICLFFWLEFFTSYYLSVLYVVMVVTVFTCLFVIRYQSKFNRRSFVLVGRFIKRLAFFIFIPMIIFLVLFVRSWSYTKAFSVVPDYAANCNTNIVGFFIPAQENVFLLDLSNKLYDHFGIEPQDDTRSYYLGGLFLLLAIVSFIYFRKNQFIRSLGIMGLVVFLYSLGLRVALGSVTIFSGPSTLYYWLAKIPFLGLVDCPLRFPIGIHLAVAILVGYLLVTIWRKHQRVGLILLGMLFLVFIVDFNRSALTFTPVGVPSIYRQIANYQDNKTVLEISTGLADSKGGFGNDHSGGDFLYSKQMYWQTIYKKPRVGGYISRVPLSTYHFFAKQPVISDIFKLTTNQGEWSGATYTKKEVEVFLQKFNIGYIVIPPVERQPEYYAKIQELLKGISYTDIQIDNYILLKL